MIGPEKVGLCVCKACGRTDRWDILRKRHRPPYNYQGARAKGGVCPGPVVVVTYLRKEGEGE